MGYSRDEKTAALIEEKLPGWHRDTAGGRVRFSRGRISIEPDSFLGPRVRIYLDGKRISAVRIPASSAKNISDSMKDIAILAWNLTCCLDAKTEKSPGQKEP